MSTRFLGLPLAAWGLACFALAVVWVFVWPAAEAAEARGLRLFLMRWGHALTWGLLGAMCLMKATGQVALAGWGNVVGLSALFVYLGFLGATYVLR